MNHKFSRIYRDVLFRRLLSEMKYRQECFEDVMHASQIIMVKKMIIVKLE